MKPRLKSAILLFVFFFAMGSSFAISFEDALKQKLITYHVRSNPNNGKNMQLTMASNSRKSCTVELESGRIFYTENPGYQPFVVIRPSVITLDSLEKKDLWVYARCGNSSASAPSPTTTFKGTAMGPPQLIETLQQINSLRISSSGFCQSVVWHYTNGHDISTIHSEDLDRKSENLIIKNICAREKISSPWYRKAYEPASSGDDMEFSGVPASIVANLEVVLSQESDLRIELIDDKNNQVKILGVYLKQQPGICKIPLDLNLKGIEKGNYTVHVINSADRILETKELQI